MMRGEKVTEKIHLSFDQHKLKKALSLKRKDNNSWHKLKKALSLKRKDNNSQNKTHHSKSPAIPSSPSSLSRIPIPTTHSSKHKLKKALSLKRKDNNSWHKLKKALSVKRKDNNSQNETHHSKSPAIPSSPSSLSRLPIPTTHSSKYPLFVVLIKLANDAGRKSYGENPPKF
ncbi:hypothetical protein MTR67_007714 [Solanum verrucosum]|uniref:Uncharacterized protein n=1 Tax=Solanum verrucosum TaxID=315347 RepID=A0AAF0Q6L8_SOLVR|nr:hypothetical protein MTR67_007714 [Solanum verrucosum]